MINLEGKRILITGASSGIGKAFAIQAASLGAKLIVFGRNEQRLNETFHFLAGEGHEYHAFDITDYAVAEQIIRKSVSEGNKISGFVHSAGIENTLPVRASTPKIFKKVFEVNVFAGFEIARILSQKNIVNPDGASFVFLSSVKGKLGDQGKLIYCSSKSALLSGVRALALELAAKKIRCNCVLPGVVMTPMSEKLFESIPPERKQKIVEEHPLGLGAPEDIANLISFLISDLARWITGSEYIIDGGYSA
jgi:NAD(P)-dependent dehydrogenase (short-subunit alcohol dehydrogenase family)